MTLLEDVVTGASGTAPLPHLLRGLRVIASRTGAAPLEDWTACELEGYPSAETLPRYRGPFTVPVRGHFVGPASSEVRNVPIPPVTLPKDGGVSALFNLWLLDSVAEIEEMASEGSVQRGWPADALQDYNDSVENGTVRRVVQPGMVLTQAVQPVPAHIFVGVLDAVRNRILDLALKLESVTPSAGQANASAEERRDAAQVIDTYFQASSHAATNSHGLVRHVGLPAASDAHGLIAYLAAAGLRLNELAEVQRAVQGDREAGDDTAGKWPRVRAWFARAATHRDTDLRRALTAAGESFLT